LARQLSPEFRVGGPSAREIAVGLEGTCKSLKGFISYDGHAVRPGPLTAALAWWWLGLPRARQIEVAREALAALEQLLSEPDPLSPAALGDAPDDGRRAEGYEPRTGAP
jgi:hypothetical protein